MNAFARRPQQIAPETLGPASLSHGQQASVTDTGRAGTAAKSPTTASFHGGEAWVWNGSLVP